METVQFNKLSYMEQLEFVNKELGAGKSLRKLSDELRISKTTIRDRMTKIGYSFDINSRRYVKNDGIITPSIKEDDNNRTTIIEPKEIDASSGTRVLNNKKVNVNINPDDREKLNYLFSNFEKLKELIENCDNDMTKLIRIEVEEETDFNYRTTIRVNNVVWDKFKKFADKHKEFTQKDLLSQAISDYMNKYE